MATLTGQSIASSYEQLLHTDTDGGGNGATLVPIKDGDNGTTFSLELATTSIAIGATHKLYLDGGGNTYITESSADTIQLATGGTTALTIDSNQRVGIGTDSPGDYYATQLVLNCPDNGGMTFLSGNTTHASGIFFADGTGASAYRGQMVYDHNNDSFGIWTGATNAIMIDSSQNATFAGSITTPTGINFPDDASSNPSDDVNTLDSYEEGTYTVTLTPSGSGSIGLDGNYDTASYTKIGRQVTVMGHVDTTSTGFSSPVGFIKVNVPFTIGDGTELSQRGSGSVFIYNSSANIQDFGVFMAEGEAFFRIYLATGTGLGSTSANQLDTSTSIQFAVTYFV